MFLGIHGFFCMTSLPSGSVMHFLKQPQVLADKIRVRDVRAREIQDQRRGFETRSHGRATLCLLCSSLAAHAVVCIALLLPFCQSEAASLSFFFKAFPQGLFHPYSLCWRCCGIICPCICGYEVRCWSCGWQNEQRGFFLVCALVEQSKFEWRLECLRILSL